MNALYIAIRNLAKGLKDALTPARLSNLDNLDSKIEDVISTNDIRVNRLDSPVSGVVASDDSRIDYLDAPLSSVSSGVRRLIKVQFSAPPNSSGSVTLPATVNPSKCYLFHQCSLGKTWAVGYYGLSHAPGIWISADGTSLQWDTPKWTDTLTRSSVSVVYIVEAI